jgi:hypothetical protein
MKIDFLEKKLLSPMEELRQIFENFDMFFFVSICNNDDSVSVKNYGFEG